MGTRLFVGGLSSRAREQDLEDFFDGFGRIKDIVIKDRFGFVEFEDYRDAEDAVKELDGKQLQGERIGVEFARRPGQAGRNEGRRIPGFRTQRRSPERRPVRPGPPIRTNYRLIVENLSSGVSWQDLKDYMRKAGEVTFTEAHRDRSGEGVVEYASREGMERAMDELDDMEIRGRRIRLIRDDRRSSRSRSKSRSRSRRRSSRTPTKSKSRSKSRSRSASRSRKDRNDRRSKSRSASPRKRSRSKSKSPARKQSRSRSRTKSRSRSRTRSRS